MMDCETRCDSCQGGNLAYSWEFVSVSGGDGVVSEECYPYTSGGGEPGTC